MHGDGELYSSVPSLVRLIFQCRFIATTVYTCMLTYNCCIWELLLATTYYMPPLGVNCNDDAVSVVHQFCHIWHLISVGSKGELASA